jgi:hypothetical protein
MRRRTGLFAVVALSTAVAACSVATVGSPVVAPSATLNPNQLALLSPSPSPWVEPTRTPVPTALVTPSPRPSSGTASPTAAASVVMPHADPELEALLPAVLSKTSLSRFSMQGSVFTAGGDMCILICGDEPYRYAKELGVGIDDVTIAFAVSDSLGIGMIAYRARGAKTDRLIPARIAIGGYTGHGGLYDLPVTAAGRPATYLDAGFGQNGEYLMTRHDVLFIVLGEAPSNGTCRPGFCASPPPGPWSVPAYVTEALGEIP